jgi:hypothetical protein
MATIPAGTWVEVERVVLKPAERAPNIPEDTARTPYVLRVSGFLTETGEMGKDVTVRTLIGRTLSGTLRTVNPSYHHDFGDTVPELLTIGLGGEA